MNGINALIAQGGWKEPKFDLMETARNALLLKRAKQEIEAYPEEQNWVREQRGVARTKFSQEQAAEQRRLDWEPFTDEVMAAEGLKKIIPFLNEQNWDASMEHLGTVKKIDKSYLPSLASLKQQASSEGISSEEFPQWLEDYKMKKVHDLDYYKAQTERGKLGKPDLSEKGKISRDYEAEVRDKATKLVEESTRAGTPIPYSEAVESVKSGIEKKYYPEKAEAKSNIGKLIDEYNALDPNDPNKQFYLGAIKKQAESTGFTIDVDKDGNVRVVQGPLGAAGGMTKTTQTRLEEKLLNTADQLGRLSEIEKSYKAEYQKIPFRAQQSWASLREKTGADLTPEEKTNLSNFSMFRRQAISNINLYIKEITGAQMSELESKRLRQAMPDPGEGIFGGDSPTVFEAKMKDTIYQLRLASIRYAYLKKHGLGIEAIPLGSMESIVNKRGDDIADELSKRGMKGSELEKAVSNQIISEFGMMP